MPVIDIDSHFYEPFDWLKKAAPDLAREAGEVDAVTLVATTAYGEVVSTLPASVKPEDPIDLLPKELSAPYKAADAAGKKYMADRFLAGIEAVPGAHKTRERLAFLDAQGIDTQFVLPTFAFTPISRLRRERPDRGPAIMAAYNRWAAETLSDSGGRLLPVAIVDLTTMSREVFVRELTAMRKAGSRCFTFWASPVNGKSLSHPDFEWAWAAAADLGMMAMVHVGAGRPQIDMGWLNNGRPYPHSILSYLGMTYQIAEIFTSEMIVSGNCARHPNLRIAVAELGIDWVPAWLRRMDRGIAYRARTDKEVWPYPLKPSEYARRQIRVSPLDHLSAREVIEDGGADMVVFSSDYPHPEGGTDATARYRKHLEALPAERRAAFFGGIIAADLALAA